METVREENEKKKEYLKQYGKALRQEKRIEEELERLKLDRMLPGALAADGMPKSSSLSDLSDYMAEVPDDEHIYVISMYWIPEELVDKHVTEDKVPYDIWIEKGYVRTCPGNKISYRDVKAWFVEIQEKQDI